MNDFVKYLNTMNNAKSENMNALAESQVMSEYYSRISVKRNISDTVYDYLTKGNEAIILTGHAGDGKTSILIQVLEKLGYFEDGKKALKVEDLFKDLHYIKDMSELSTTLQKELLVKFLSAPRENRSSIIVSNTGPIINAFNNIFDENDPTSEDLEKEILNGITKVVSNPICFSLNNNEYKFRLINIANIDNSYLVQELLKKITDESLWQACSDCKSKLKCPIYNNCNDLINNMLVLNEQITRIYYWLSEKGTRLTIRQVIAHITFSLTSNLFCDQIEGFGEGYDNLFKFSYANAFFGYKGFLKNAEASNLRTIKELNTLKVDEKSLGKIDNQLFVKEDFSSFNTNIRRILTEVVNDSYYSLGDFNSDEMRKAFRRYYILFSNVSEEKINHLDELIMSEAIINYYNAVICKILDVNFKRKIEKIIFTSLFRLFIGVYPKKNEENLYITLRKDFHLVQNTQMLIGKVPKSDLKVVLKPKSNMIEPELVKAELFFEFGHKSFLLSSEFLDFLYKFSEGEVFTNLQPSFTFGLSRLKSDLIKNYRVSDESMTLIIIQNDKIHKMKLKIEDEKIFVD